MGIQPLKENDPRLKETKYKREQIEPALHAIRLTLQEYDRVALEARLIIAPYRTNDLTLQRAPKHIRDLDATIEDAMERLKKIGPGTTEQERFPLPKWRRQVSTYRTAIQRIRRGIEQVNMALD